MVQSISAQNESALLWMCTLLRFFSSVSYHCRQTAIILPYSSAGHTIRLQKLHHRSLLVFGLSCARCNVLHALGLLLIAPKLKKNNCLWSRLHLLVADSVVNKANKFSVTTTLYFMDPLLHVSAYKLSSGRLLYHTDALKVFTFVYNSLQRTFV
jgi:hypothetical protein